MPKREMLSIRERGEQSRRFLCLLKTKTGGGGALKRILFEFTILICASLCTSANLTDRTNTPTKQAAMFHNDMIILKPLKSKPLTHTQLRVSVGQPRLRHKAAQNILTRRGLNGWFIEAEADPNHIVVGTLYASVWRHPHRNGHLSF